MPTYFHDWRHMAGCVTIVMALVFAAGWLRSQFRHDWIRIRISQTHVFVFSSNFSELIWYCRRETWDRPIFGTMPSYHEIWKDGFTFEWHRAIFGFHVLKATGISTKLPILICVAPYWSIVLPLMLVSMYLLLSKS